MAYPSFSWGLGGLSPPEPTYCLHLPACGPPWPWGLVGAAMEAVGVMGFLVALFLTATEEE